MSDLTSGITRTAVCCRRESELVEEDVAISVRAPNPTPEISERSARRHGARARREALLLLIAVLALAQVTAAQSSDDPDVPARCFLELPNQSLMPLWQELQDSKAIKGHWLSREATEAQGVGSTALVLWAFSLAHQGPKEDRRRHDGRRLNTTYFAQLDRGLSYLLRSQLTHKTASDRGRVGPADEFLVHVFATLALVDLASFSDRDDLSVRARLAVTYLLAQRESSARWTGASPDEAVWGDLALVVAAEAGLTGVAGLSDARDEIVESRSRELRHVIMRGMESQRALHTMATVVVLHVAGVWRAEPDFANSARVALEAHLSSQPRVALPPIEAFWTWSAQLVLTEPQIGFDAEPFASLGEGLRGMKPGSRMPLEWAAGPFGTALDGAALSHALYANVLCTQSSLLGRR